ncbi:MAG: universal stress protein [Chloroflexota bacterium]|nr:MAG: universal stress protein [Chloroflexota bacterium]
MRHSVTRAILVPLDGSDLSERAIEAARRLAGAMSASIVLTRVVHASPPEEHTRQAAAVEAAEKYLNDIAAGLRAQGEAAICEACAGDPAERIVEQAGLWRAEIIVMATHGRGGVGRLIHGSVADSVVRRSSVPILLVPARAEHHARLDGDSVVVAVDGSPFAEHALAHAAEMAREMVASLVITRAVFWDPAPLHGLAPSLTTIDEMRDDAQQYVDNLAAEVQRAGVDARGVVVVGPTTHVILDEAESANAAVIVLATHGRGGLGRFAMGSIATEIVTHARRPVLLIHPLHAGEGATVVEQSSQHARAPSPAT